MVRHGGSVAFVSPITKRVIEKVMKNRGSSIGKFDVAVTKRNERGMWSCLLAI